MISADAGRRARAATASGCCCVFNDAEQQYAASSDLETSCGEMSTCGNARNKIIDCRGGWNNEGLIQLVTAE